MKTHSPIARRSAFTLIELLIVISIIGLLAVMATPAITGVMKKAKEATVKSVLKDLELGIKNYQLEYSRLPIQAGSGSGEEPEPISEGNTLLKALMGTDTQLNPRGIVYIDPKQGKGGAGGLVGTEGSWGLSDPWGEPYQVVMDSNYDNKIANPDVQNEDTNVSTNAPQNLIKTALIFSTGEDKVANTKDDIVSWR